MLNAPTSGQITAMAVNKFTYSLIKPSDATSWISCIRRVWLDKHQSVESEIDGFSQLLIDFGLRHEATILAKLESQHAVIKADSFDHTFTLMLQGAPVIY